MFSFFNQKNQICFLLDTNTCKIWLTVFRQNNGTYTCSSLIYVFIFRPEESDLNKFGLNWAAVWVKMGSSWACVFIYLFTLFRPKCCPGRDLTFRRTDEVLVPGENESMRRESTV